MFVLCRHRRYVPSLYNWKHTQYKSRSQSLRVDWKIRWSGRNIIWSKNIAFEKQEQRHFLLLVTKKKKKKPSILIVLNTAFHITVLNEGLHNVRWRKTKRIFDEKKKKSGKRARCLENRQTLPVVVWAPALMLKGLFFPSNYLLRKAT